MSIIGRSTQNCLGYAVWELDPEKYVVVAAIIPDNPASHECVTCGWSGNFRKNKVIKDIIE
jgi:hypothetical protein